MSKSKMPFVLPKRNRIKKQTIRVYAMEKGEIRKHFLLFNSTHSNGWMGAYVVLEIPKTMFLALIQDHGVKYLGNKERDLKEHAMLDRTASGQFGWNLV